MGRPLAIALLLGACAGPDEVPSPSGSKPGTTFGEPISTQQVLQGIQIGEGGDPLPCDPVLTAIDDGSVDVLFADIEGSWPQLPYAYEGLAGAADVSVALSSTWELTWTDYPTASTFDCLAEPPVTVGALWLAIEGDDAAVHQPVFAATLDTPPTRFVGDVPGAELGLDGATYDVEGLVDGVELELRVYEDLIDGQPLGAFGG